MNGLDTNGLFVKRINFFLNIAYLGVNPENWHQQFVTISLITDTYRRNRLEPKWIIMELEIVGNKNTYDITYI